MKGVEIMKEYNYKNDCGYNKKLLVELREDGDYNFSIWSMDTGDFCGAGSMTKEKLDAFLEHYHIHIEG